MEVLKCSVCGKTGFKSKAGLEGHKKIAHGVDKRKAYPDEIRKRLNLIEQKFNPIVKTFETMTDIFERAMERDREMLKHVQDNTNLTMKLANAFTKLAPHIILDGTLKKHLIKIGVLKKEREKVISKSRF